MHVFLLMVWGGFFLMWPRSTLLATVTIPVIGVGLILATHNWAPSAGIPLPAGYVLDAPWQSDPIVAPHWWDAPLVTPSDK